MIPNTEGKQLRLMFRKIFLSFVIASLTLASCTSGKQDSAQTEADKNTGEEQVETFEATGVVVSIPPSKRNFIVKHNDIPGFMDAMTMAFPVRDTSILSDIVRNDSIRFIIESKGNETYVVDAEKVQ